jgi:hypothetical protein
MNQALLDAIPSTPTSFSDICGTLEVQQVSPELRLEMKVLVDQGLVLQTGQSRGTKYTRVAGGQPAPQLVTGAVPLESELRKMVTATLEPFSVICARLGMNGPSPELRLEMRALIEQGIVRQVGERRGAQYQLASAPHMEPSTEVPETGNPIVEGAAPEERKESELLKFVTETLEPFSIICARLGLESPTPELRLEMRALIEQGIVRQVGERRSARYMLASAPYVEPTIAEESPLEETIEKVVTEKVQPEKIRVKPFLPPKPNLGWEWASPETTVFQQKLVIDKPLHGWVLERWEVVASQPDHILEIGMRLSKLPECPYTMLDLCNGISDLAQMGKLRVRTKLVNGLAAGHIFGAWVENLDETEAEAAKTLPLEPLEGTTDPAWESPPA